MKLTVDLVPKTSFFKNLRSELPAKAWDALRYTCYENAGNRCEICGGQGEKHTLECHEKWQYDESTGIQKLIGVIGLCPLCHACKHILFAKMQGRYQVTLKHLAKVNGISLREAEQHVAEAFAVWQRRSKIQWRLDLSWLDAQ